ncbi:MAG: 16S rRNA (guanine(527)-N(7))-methyltransferase RsmG [Clostridia bacterium]|nr:16S rRNA (guanine(527)-N(7))-methyltransferase RsmG [Clostridia bacterium]
MDKTEFYEEVHKYVPQITENKINQFYNYMNMLIEWNNRINLTAITEPKEIILKHFIDSMTILKEIKNNSRIIDVGTGAGFPGIPLKISNETLEVVLLDSLNKRINFVNEVINVLELQKIQAVHFRVEEVGQDNQYREKFDVATSRAVASLNILAEYMLPLVKVGGVCICMKGSEIEKEIQNSKKAIEILGGKIEKVESFTLANTDMKRNNIIIRKEKETPNKYPRKVGTPSKEPLK